MFLSFPSSPSTIGFVVYIISFTSILLHTFHPLVFTSNLCLCLYAINLMQWTSLTRTVWTPFVIPGLLAICPVSLSKGLTTFCFPTCVIPTYIKFGIICEKIDVLNKSLPYAIKFLARILTVLSFLFFCVVVADCFLLF